jgi:hypothetical protein
MNARTALKRGIALSLFAALLALLGTVGAQAQDASLAEPGSFLVRPAAAALDVVCGIDFANEDPYMWVDASDIPCPELALPEIRSIEFTGNVAWSQVVVGNETVLHVWVNRDGTWERFPFATAPDAGEFYMLEQENAFVQQQNPGPTAAVGSPSISADVRGSRYTVDTDADFSYLLEQENAYEAQHNPGATAAVGSPGISADVRGSRYTVDTEAEFLNMLEEENAYEAQHNAAVIAPVAAPSISADTRGSRYTLDTDAEFLNMLEEENAYEAQHNPGATATSASPSLSVDVRGESYWTEWLARQVAAQPEAATLDISVDVRGGSYWDEWFARQQVAFPAAASPLASESFRLDALEPEIDVLNGSAASTLDDLLAGLFGSALPGQLGAGEDLTRELE